MFMKEDRMLAIQGSIICCLILEAVLVLAAPPSNQTFKLVAEKRARPRLRPSNFTRPVPSNITLPVPSNFTLPVPSNSTAELGCGVSSYSSLSLNENSGDAEEDHEEDPLEVIGGQEAAAGQFPWQVKMVLGGRLPYCGGVIIDPYYILTAAHCLRNCTSEITHAENMVSIRVGAHEYNIKNDHGQRYEVDKIMVHEKYCSAKFIYDIGLVKLRRPLSFRLTEDGYGSVNAICLPQPNTQYEDGEAMTIAGWGLTNNELRTKPEVLQTIRVPYVDDARCDRIFTATGGMYFQPEREVCAGGRENEGSCSGDSGGPLMRQVEGGIELVGLVSRAFPCSRKGRPTVYAQVDAFLDWIQQNMN